MRRSSVIAAFQRSACTAVVVLLAEALAYGQWQGSAQHESAPVYQRRAFERSHGHGKRRDNKFGHFPIFQSPQVNAGWFQRPYPYHLDYYRMRYGGSYAPYFGNLYGPPQVVTAPPYYGPYYGGYGYPVEGMYGPRLQSPVNGASETQPQSNNGTLPAPQP